MGPWRERLDPAPRKQYLGCAYRQRDVGLDSFSRQQRLLHDDGRLSKIDRRVLEESTLKFSVAWAAIAHTRVNVPLPQPTAPLSFHLGCLWQQFLRRDAGLSRERNWDPPTRQSPSVEGLEAGERQRPAERGALAYECNLEQPEAPKQGAPGRSKPSGGVACATAGLSLTTPCQ